MEELKKIREQLAGQLMEVDPGTSEYTALFNELVTLDRQIQNYEKQENEVEQKKIDARSRRTEAWLKFGGPIVAAVITVVGAAWANNFTLDRVDDIEKAGGCVTGFVKSAVNFFKLKL